MAFRSSGTTSAGYELDSIGLEALASDIKQRRARLASLAAQEARLDAIVHAARDLFYLALALGLMRLLGIELLTGLSSGTGNLITLGTALGYLATLYYRYRRLLPIVRERVMLGSVE